MTSRRKSKAWNPLQQFCSTDFMARLGQSRRSSRKSQQRGTAAAAAEQLELRTLLTALDPANLLVSYSPGQGDFAVTEYTTSGSAVQTFDIPYDAGGAAHPVTESLRDVIVAPDGNIRMYNGTFTPTLTSLDPESLNIEFVSISELSTANNGTYGGIATYGNFTFLSDMQTGGGGTAKGIVRYDHDSVSAVRFSETTGFQDLTIGLDGLLYGLQENSPGYRIQVFDPQSLEQVRTFQLDFTDHRGIAVDEDGSLFAATWGGEIRHYDSDGGLLNSVAAPVNNLADIDIRADGKIAVGSSSGDGFVLLTDTSLSSVTSLPLNAYYAGRVFVSFTEPFVPDSNSAPTINSTSFSFDENQPDGTSIGTVVANDPDAGDMLTYSIAAGNGDGAFAINAATGELTIADTSLLDYEVTTSRQVDVTVSDNEGLSDSATITLNLTDVNEAPNIDSATFAIPENSGIGTSAGIVTASDVDTGDSIHFSIAAGNVGNTFGIHSVTGEIIVINPALLDHESTSPFNLTVTATDTGGLSASADVIVSITDINEAPTIDSATFSIPENSGIGTSVGTVTASDVDAGDTVSFAITAGNIGNGFGIHSVTGEIIVINPAVLDFETTPQFNLTVTATDSGGLVASTNVVVLQTDVNESPTVDSAAFSVPENSGIGTSAGTVATSDVDAFDSAHFTITAGNIGNSFGIHSVTGEIIVINPAMLDYETTPQFDLTVTVTDSGGLTASAPVTISLTDVEEVPPTKFYVVDITSDSAFRYGADGGALASTSLNNPKSRGVAADISGTTYWVVDANKTVYVYDAESGTQIGSWQASGFSKPQGITTDGTDIWIVDNKLDKVFHYSGAASRLSGSQSADSSFAVNRKNRNAKGIVTDGSSIWTVQAANKDKVFKYSMDGTLQGYWTIAGGNTSPTGIAIDPANVSNIWIVDNASDSVYQYSGAANQTSGTLTADATFALAAGNTNPQGIADPPPPSAFSGTAAATGLTGDSNAAAQEGLESFPVTSAASSDLPGRDSLLTFQSTGNSVRRPDGVLIESQGTATEVANSSNPDIDAEQSSATEVASFSTESEGVDAEAVCSLLADEAWLSYRRQ